MKKIFVLLLLLIINISSVLAKDYSVNFNGEKFNLLFSIKNKDFGGYLNEYYKKGETYNIWTELIAVHHFPNAYSPIDRIRDFKEYLGSMKVPSSLTFDDKKNQAMIDFIIISDSNMPIVLEFNIFKYEKSKKCGSIAIQYAKRYSATTTMQIEAIKKDIEKNRNKLIKKLKNFEIPEIITQDIDKCISASDIIKENENNAVTEKTADTNVNENETSDTEKTTNNVNNNATITEQTKAESPSENNTESITNTDTQNTESENEIKTAEINENEDIATEEKKDNITNEKLSEYNVKNENNNTNEKPTINEIKSAPVPCSNNIDVKLKNVKTKHKSKNNEKYEIKNDKNDYYAKPRTKEELKNEIKEKKQRQKDMAKQRKIQDKNNKKQAKLDNITAKKQEKINKKEAKKAEKAAKKPYTISNKNSDLIAKPRTKKEIKERNKQLYKQRKERVKEAKKKLTNEL